MMNQIPLILAQQDSGSLGADKPLSLPDQGSPAGQNAVEGQSVGTEGSAPAGPQGGGMSSLIFIVAIFAVFWFILMGGQRREKKKRAKMLAAIAKGSKVQTVGGILGTVAEVRDNEIVIKVDENANIRIKFTRSAIQAVVDDQDA